MERFEIKRIEPDEVEAVHDILRRCGEDMKERFGLTHWIPPYPLHLMRQSTQEKRVYAVLDQDQVIAFYQKAGYHPRGTFVVFSPRRGEGEIACFEKVV